MKKLNIVVFANDNEMARHSNSVCEKLSNLPATKEFCGIWGEIKSNDRNVLSAVAETVNYFLGSDKTEVFFGCCEKDYENVLEKINLKNCQVVKLSYLDV